VVGAPFRGFYRPYYGFRPRFSLGLGLFVGYPVAFPYFGYEYPYPYAYSYPYAYPYPYSYSYPSPYPAASYPYPYASSYPPAGAGYPSPYPPQYSNQYPAQSSNPYPPQSSNQYPIQPGQGSVGVAPGQTGFGGVSFDIAPGDAQVYVDGSYMGLVSNFSATKEPLTLTPGRHSIEVRAAGYRTMVFDADVTPGQVIPYQGSMQR
jgi:hypothetical protein